jgi:hypothetical protein
MHTAVPCLEFFSCGLTDRPIVPATLELAPAA